MRMPNETMMHEIIMKKEEIEKKQPWYCTLYNPAHIQECDCAALRRCQYHTTSHLFSSAAFTQE